MKNKSKTQEFALHVGGVLKFIVILQKKKQQKIPDSINRTTFFTLLFSFPLKLYLEINMEKIHLIDKLDYSYQIL